MAFKLSQRSLDKLDGVHPDLVKVVKKAIEYTDVDFGVIYGVRDLETQKKLYDAGKSQTMKSKHLVQEDGYAHAVDLMAYDGSNPSWDIVDYDNIADAMRKAGKEVGVDLVWGPSTSHDNANMTDLRKAMGSGVCRSAFIMHPCVIHRSTQTVPCRSGRDHLSRWYRGRCQEP